MTAVATLDRFLLLMSVLLGLELMTRPRLRFGDAVDCADKA